MRIDPPEYTIDDYDDMLASQRSNVNVVLESINEQSLPWEDEFDSCEMTLLIDDFKGHIKELERIRDTMSELECEKGMI